MKLLRILIHKHPNKTRIFISHSHNERTYNRGANNGDFKDPRKWDRRGIKRIKNLTRLYLRITY
jgi:hypothetical protein